jgi:hypothetical protein
MVWRWRHRRPAATTGQQLVGKRSLQGVGGGRLAVVEIEGRGWKGRPGVAQAAVHLLQGGHVTRLGQQLDTHSGLPLPLSSEDREREQ